MKPITSWKKFNEKKGMWKHNHIEDSHVENNQPMPESQEQKKSWPKSKWAKSFGFLNSNSVIKNAIEQYRDEV